VAGYLPARGASVRVDAQKLAQPLVKVLRAVLRISGAATVAHADVEQTVRPELQLPAVVVRIGLPDEQQLPRAVEERAAPARTKLDDTRVAVPVGVVDVDAVVARVVRAERDGQQSALASARDARPDVEER